MLLLYLSSIVFQPNFTGNSLCNSTKSPYDFLIRLEEDRLFLSAAKGISRVVGFFVHLTIYLYNWINLTMPI